MGRFFGDTALASLKPQVDIAATDREHVTTAELRVWRRAISISNFRKTRCLSVEKNDRNGRSRMPGSIGWSAAMARSSEYCPSLTMGKLV
jgi:hypothetical protein